MKKYLILFLIFVLAPLLVMAQGTPIPITDAITQILAAINAGTLKGLGIVVLVVQILMYLSESTLGAIAGKWQWLIVAGLSLAGAIITGFVQGLPWATVLLSGAVTAAFQVFVNQGIQLFTPSIAAANKAKLATPGELAARRK